MNFKIILFISIFFISKKSIEKIFSKKITKKLNKFLILQKEQQ